MVYEIKVKADSPFLSHADGCPYTDCQDDRYSLETFIAALLPPFTREYYREFERDGMTEYEVTSVTEYPLSVERDRAGFVRIHGFPEPWYDPEGFEIDVYHHCDAFRRAVRGIKPGRWNRPKAEMYRRVDWTPEKMADPLSVEQQAAADKALEYYGGKNLQWTDRIVPYGGKRFAVHQGAAAEIPSWDFCDTRELRPFVVDGRIAVIPGHDYGPITVMVLSRELKPGSEWVCTPLSFGWLTESELSEDPTIVSERIEGMREYSGYLMQH